MTQSPNHRFHPWQLLPYLIPLVAVVVLAVIAYAAGQHLLTVAVDQAKEDAALIHWWHEAQRTALNTQATALAHRVGAEPDFAQVVADTGLAEHYGYLAWLAPDQQVNAAINADALVGNPLSRKLLAYVATVGYAATDLWHDADSAYFITLAPVPQEQGGGVIVLQTPVDAAYLTQLAQLTGRAVLLYGYREQSPWLSSAAALATDPPWFYPNWLEQVATGQLPAATRTRNYAGGQIVGITAFRDFAGISYSGYWALVEPTQSLTQQLPWLRYGLFSAGAMLVVVAAAWVLQRNTQHYLATFRQLDRRARHSFKLRMSGGLLLAFLPVLVVAWVIVAYTGAESRRIDLRTTQIAKDRVIATVDGLINQLAQFTGTPLPAQPTATAEQIRLANGFDFVLFATASEPIIATAPGLALPATAPAQLGNLDSGATLITQVDKQMLLVARQPRTDGTVVVGGFALSGRLQAISEVLPLDFTLLEGATPRYTGLTDLEVATITFTPAMTAQLRSAGQISYVQNVHWHASKLTAYTLALGSRILAATPWHLVISQASTAWANALTALRALSLATVAAGLLIIVVLVATILNLDQPMLLRKLYTGFGFILPALIWLLWWQLGPALFTLYLSFHKWSVLDPAKPFVGLHNYRLIWEDAKFWNAMGNTLYYSLQIPVGMLLALALALALNRQLRGIRLLRTIYYMPAVTSIVVVSLMWQLLYNKEMGILNYLLSFIGLGPYGWLQSTTMAMPSIMGMEVWLELGARMLLFLAGLQSIPYEFYEAAEVDGANALRKLWHITLPLLAPTTFFVFVTAVIGSFQVFGPIYVLTQGGPAGATDVAVHRIYFEAWQNLRFGYASAETVILFACLFVVTAIQFRYFGRRVSYG